MRVAQGVCAWILSAVSRLASDGLGLADPVPRQATCALEAASGTAKAQAPAAAGPLHREQRCELSGRIAEHRPQGWHVDLVDAEAGNRERERPGDSAVGEERRREAEGAGDALALGLRPSGVADLLQISLELLPTRR